MKFAVSEDIAFLKRESLYKEIGGHIVVDYNVLITVAIAMFGFGMAIGLLIFPYIMRLK